MDQIRRCSGCDSEKSILKFYRLGNKLPLQDITNLQVVSAYIQRTNPKLLKTCDSCAARVKGPNKARNDRAKGLRLARRAMQEREVEVCDYMQALNALRGDRGEGLPNEYGTPTYFVLMH
jgi:hypothetical protein